MYNLHQTEGVVLFYSDIGEADRFYVLYTENFGKISVLAKGARFEKSKLRGHLAVFSQVRVSFVEGKDCFRLIDAEEIRPPADASDIFLAAFNRMSLFIDRMIKGQERDAALWNFLRAAFSHLSGSGFSWRDINGFESLFKARFLYRLGYVSLPEGILSRIISAADWPCGEQWKSHLGDIEKLFRKGLGESQL